MQYNKNGFFYPSAVGRVTIIIDDDTRRFAAGVHAYIDINGDKINMCYI